MVAAPRPKSPLHTRHETALVRALHELRQSERASALTLSVLVFEDDAFWVGRRLTLESSLRDTTPRSPERWDPPVGLDPKDPRRPGLIELDAKLDAGSERARSSATRVGLVLSDRTVLGVLELLEPRGRTNAVRAEAFIARIATQLAAWVDTAPDPRARLVVGPRGLCLRSGEFSPQALPALDTLFALSGGDAGPQQRRFGFGLAAIELEALEGIAGPHLLVTLSRPSFYVVPQELALTVRQREIADLASHGLTIGEIAAMTKRAPDTIKTHLKSVYRTLGVANRLELRDLLDAR